MSSPKRAFKGIWIPKRLWESDLTPFQICFLAEIDALSDDAVGCNASNEFLAMRFKTTPASISQMISKLAKWGWIEWLSKPGESRRIRFKFPSKSSLTSDDTPSPTSDDSSPTSDEPTPPHYKERKQKSTVKRDSSSKTQFQEMEMPDGLRGEKFRKAWRDWVEFRMGMGGKKIKCWDMVFKRNLEEMAEWGESDAIAGINNAIASCWQKPYRPKSNDRNSNQSTTNEPLWWQKELAAQA